MASFADPVDGYSWGMRRETARLGASHPAQHELKNGEGSRPSTGSRPIRTQTRRRSPCSARFPIPSLGFCTLTCYEGILHHVYTNPRMSRKWFSAHSMPRPTKLAQKQGRPEVDPPRSGSLSTKNCATRHSYGTSSLQPKRHASSAS